MRKGFTLLEILTVVAIVGMLVGLLMPAFNRIHEQARRRKAATETAVIENAIKAYFSEYGEWPIPEDDMDDAIAGMAIVFTYTNDNEEVIHELRRNAAGNTKQIVFLEEDNFSTKDEEHQVHANGPLRDPWGKSYVIKIDTRYPGKDSSIADGVDVATQ